VSILRGKSEKERRKSIKGRGKPPGNRQSVLGDKGLLDQRLGKKGSTDRGGEITRPDSNSANAVSLGERERNENKRGEDKEGSRIS